MNQFADMWAAWPPLNLVVLGPSSCLFWQLRPSENSSILVLSGLLLERQ